MSVIIEVLGIGAKLSTCYTVAVQFTDRQQELISDSIATLSRYLEEQDTAKRTSGFRGLHPVIKNLLDNNIQPPDLVLLDHALGLQMLLMDAALEVADPTEINVTALSNVCGELRHIQKLVTDEAGKNGITLPQTDYYKLYLSK